jgi:uncharacterized LabA/DUF88 family protein
MDQDRRIAVLIDADNVSDKYIQYVMDEAANFGTPTYKRIYGDWTKPQLSSWKSTLLSHSITPIQQYNYTTGKNSTDAALIIDAMDILYSGKVDGFCIVSSDSDFTRLASRLREAGMSVIGMGEKKTPAPFIAACEQFKYLEVLSVSDDAGGTEGEEESAPEKKTHTRRTQAGAREKKKLVKVLKNIINELSDEDGWAYMGAVGNVINRRLPDFDTRNYGYIKLSTLIDAFPEFEVQFRTGDKPDSTEAYVSNKSGWKSTLLKRE